MKRRMAFAGPAALASLASIAALGPARTRAAPPRAVRLGWLGTTGPRDQSYNQAFMARLAELGYAEGRNLTLEFRSTAGAADAMTIGAELARLDCDAYFAPGSEVNLRAMKVNAGDKPIVIVANDYDPVATGHIASLARPGGRITGVSQLQTELPAKRLEVLRELLPRLRRVAVLADTFSTGQLAVTRTTAARLGLDLVVHEFAQLPYEVKGAFAQFTAARAEALVGLTSGLFVPYRQAITAQALTARLPSMFNNELWVAAGGLLSYGPDFVVSYRRAAEMLARILQGANPAQTPIEQPNAVEMTLNLKTARALGLAVPHAIRLRADKVIE